MSTCGICLKDFEVALEQETRGHRACTLEEVIVDQDELQDTIHTLEMKLMGAEDEIDELEGQVGRLHEELP